MPVRAQQVQAHRYGGPEVLEVVDVEVPDPGPGEVTIEVRAVGLNPVDVKVLSGAMGADPSRLPLVLGSEVAGVLTALGDGAEIATGGGAVGDAVLAFRIEGGYAGAVTVPASDVFAKPDALDFPEAANLLLVAATAADMLRVQPVPAGGTVLVHGASGAVGVSLLQQLRARGVRAIGTASGRNHEVVRRFGGEPVAYGEGLAERVRALAPDGVAAAFDTVGTDEAVDVSLALVGDPTKVVTIAAFTRLDTGILLVGGADPVSARFRAGARAELVARAAAGELVVPVARTFPLAEATQALELLASGHPGGKLALVP